MTDFNGNPPTGGGEIPNIIDKSIEISDDLTVQGNTFLNGDLDVQGTITAIDEIEVADTLITLASGNQTDLLNSGILLEHDSNNYAGLVRRATDKNFVVLNNVTPKPSGTSVIPASDSILEARNFLAIQSVNAPVVDTQIVNATGAQLTLSAPGAIAVQTTQLDLTGTSTVRIGAGKDIVWDGKQNTQYIKDVGISGNGLLAINADNDLRILANGNTNIISENLDITAVNNVEITANTGDIVLNSVGNDVDILCDGSALVRSTEGPVSLESTQQFISLTTDLEVLIESKTNDCILNIERPTTPTNAEIKFSQKDPAREGIWRIGMIDGEDTFKLKDENDDTVFRAVNGPTNNVIFDDYKIVGNDASIDNVETSDVQVNGLARFVRPDNTTAVGLQYENTAESKDSWFMGSQVSTDSLIINNGLGERCLEVKQNKQVNIPDVLRLGGGPNGYNFPTVKGVDNQYLSLNNDTLEFTDQPTTAYAELQILNNVVPFQDTPITVIGQWEEIVGPRVSGNSQGFSSSNVLTYIGVDDKVFNISASLTWECEGKVDNIEMAIAKNGVFISTSIQRGAVDDNNNFPRNVTTTCICPLSQNDIISIQVRNLTDTDSVQIIYGTLTASSISATNVVSGAAVASNLKPHITGFIDGAFNTTGTTPFEVPFNNESSKFGITHSIAPGSNTRFTIQEDGIYTCYAQLGTSAQFTSGYLGLWFEIVGSAARYGELQIEYLGTLTFSFRPRMLSHCVMKVLAGQQIKCMCRSLGPVPTSLGGNLGSNLVADYGIVKISDLPP